MILLEAKRKQRYKKRIRQKRRRRKLCLCFGILGLLAFILADGSILKEKQLLADESQNNQAKENKEPKLHIDLENLNSQYVILTDLSDGVVLARRGSSDRIYPASLTKIMTAILAIEKTDDVSQVITLPYDMFTKLYAQDASMAGFEPGEKAVSEDLLYGIMLPSGAESCIAFADKIAGSEKEFVKLMNKKAAALGMKDTHFCNSTGLHDNNHYTTVADMEVLLRYALKNVTFREIFTSHSYSTQPSNIHPYGITFESTLFKFLDSAAVTDGEILGGKTGYTAEAGLCLASLYSTGGKEYILITAKADGSHETEQFHISDAVNVYNQIGNNKITGTANILKTVSQQGKRFSRFSVQSILYGMQVHPALL